MKRVLKWGGIVLLTPLLLILLLAVALYLPPVQDFVVARAARYASDATGMEVRVERLRLSFPLDVELGGVSVCDAPGDTLLYVGRLTVDVRLAALFRGCVQVESLDLQRAYVNTGERIPGLGLTGAVGSFVVQTDDIDLFRQHADVRGLRLDDADVELALREDTTVADTTSSTVGWVLAVRRAEVNRSRLRLRMPGDSLTVDVALTEVAADGGHLDLSAQNYRVNRFTLRSDSVCYDTSAEPAVVGIDVNHIGLYDLDMAVDSIAFCSRGPALEARLSRLTLRERCGLAVRSLTGTVQMDSTRLTLPDWDLRTADSRLQAQLHLDMEAFAPVPAGACRVGLTADLGKQDVLLLVGGLPETFVRAYPNRPVTVHVAADGNARQMVLTRCDAALEDLFRLEAHGELGRLTQPDSLQADITLALRTGNLNLLKLLATEPAALRGVNLPPMQLSGHIGAEGTCYTARMELTERDGRVTFDGRVDTRQSAYDAELHIRNLQLHDFLPLDSLYRFSAAASLHGAGTDLQSPATRAQVCVQVKQLQYGALNFDNVGLDASLRGGKGRVDFTSDNDLLRMTAWGETMLKNRKTGLAFTLDLHYIDLYALRLTPHPLRASLCMNMSGYTNLRDTHELQGGISDLTFVTADTLYRPKDLTVDMLLRPDTLYAYLLAGDLMLNGSGKGGYDKIAKQAGRFAEELTRQAAQKRIDQNRLKAFLPKLNLRIRSGHDNPVSNYLASMGYHYDNLNFDLHSSPEEGLNGGGHMYSLNTGAVMLDTLQWHIYQDSTGVKMDGRVRNGPRNKQFVFDARVNAYLHDAGAGCNITYVDGQQRTGVDIGARADLEPDGLRVRFSPLNPIIAYRHFRLNEDNYFFLGNNAKAEADIDLLADDGTGVKIYSTPNEEALQDISVSVNNLNLGELTSVMPYAPRITGFLAGDVHLVQTHEHLSVVADMDSRDLTYEGAPLGRVGLNAVYLPNADGSHFVDSRVLKEGEEVLTFSGTYTDNETGGLLDAQAELIRFPLALANGFLPEDMARLAGYVNGSVTVAGDVARPVVDGGLALDSVRVNSAAYSLALRLADDSVRVHQNHLQLDNLRIYSLNDNPLVLNGSVDFRRFDNIRIGTQLTATNFELINAPRTQKAVAYGKVYVDVNARLNGTPDDLVLRGQLNLLGNTDVTYVLKDSPLTVEDRLADLVTFVNFADSLDTDDEGSYARPMNLDMMLRLGIDQAAQVHCLLSADRSNYVDIEGGGDLTLTYTPEGDLQLNGRYTVLSGEMKYSWFVIPLKTFVIKSGSYVEFVGDVANPTLNIAATERVRATVSDENAPRTVNFDVGLSITQNLDNMGLEFTLDAPEDLTLQNELAAMSLEQRGRLAVTMLATGMYLADSNLNGGGFSTQSALNALLQSEINNITGNALKTIDVSLGMENGTSASGDTYTDYSFRFAKRFWGNRISVIIGGKVSAGNEAESIGQSLIDNVSLEYRLDKSATRYVKLFYDRNYESLIEGTLTEMGAGLVLRRKTTRLGELFLFRRPRTQPSGGEGTQP